MSVFLLAPDLPRLANLLLNRPAGPSTQPPLFRTPPRQPRRARRAARLRRLSPGMYTGSAGATGTREGGGGSPQSPLYGIWDVDRARDRRPAPPAAPNDYDRRWRRVIFDSPDGVVFQRTDDSFAHYGAAIDVNSGTSTLTKGRQQDLDTRFTFERPAPDRLMLDGDDGRIQDPRAAQARGARHASGC